MIVLFTDFGADDIYVAQVKAVLFEHAPGEVVLDLLHNAPSFGVRASAHLLAALEGRFAGGTVFFAVVDPGVGTSRDALVLEADGKWFVGPDNGLLSVIAARAARRRSWRISWRPDRLSASFHGRDLFAPIAASLAGGAFPRHRTEPIDALQVNLGADDLDEIIYVDHYGNLLTGLRAANVADDATIRVGTHALRRAGVFGNLPQGSTLWYENSIGLVEIAANQAHAAQLLGVRVGDKVVVG